MKMKKAFSDRRETASLHFELQGIKTGEVRTCSPIPLTEILSLCFLAFWGLSLVFFDLFIFAPCCSALKMTVAYIDHVLDDNFQTTATSFKSLFPLKVYTVS